MALFVRTALVVLVLVACAQRNNGEPVAKIPRDTSIQPHQAYTQLQLDSALVEQFISSEVDDVTLAQHLRNFYNSRNYQFAWFFKSGLNEQAVAFWNMHQQGPRIAADTGHRHRDLQLQMLTLLEGEHGKVLPAAEMRHVELELTRHFFEFLQKTYGSNVNPVDMQWYIPRRKVDVQALIDTFLATDNKPFYGLNRPFFMLDSAINQYMAVARAGGWPSINLQNGALKPGMEHPDVKVAKQRLAVAGLYTSADTSHQYSDAFAAAVTKAQQLFGLTADGVVGPNTAAALNVPVQQRIKQMKVNLERMRWMPQMDTLYLLANIPEFRLHVMHHHQPALQMNIVVGKAATRSVIFSDKLTYIVFSPYWNVPESIVRNEILPAMRRNPGYLRRSNMEITGYANGYPVVRQLPGGSNALGRVKFLFPNRFSIYFHDTPAKALFERTTRAFSHGCIRLQQPVELATFLLRHQPAWTEAAIREAMYLEKEEWVTVEPPVPVYIVYFTSWVDRSGQLHFRNDLYGHDQRMMEHLFE